MIIDFLPNIKIHVYMHTLKIEFPIGVKERLPSESEDGRKKTRIENIVEH